VSATSSGVILVTGASGALGRGIVESLVARMPANRVAALTRNASALADMAGWGVDVREGDYQDKASISTALEGVEKLMLVSAPAFTDAIAAHHNVISAAERAGVRHIHFASIQRKPDSRFSIAQVTDWNDAAEDELRRCSAATTILRNTLYLDSFYELLGEPDESGRIRVPAGGGRAALATRADIAEATAAVLAGDGHAGRAYDLAGSHPVTLDEVAAVLSTASGRSVRYEAVSVDEFVADRTGPELPEQGARFQADWFAAIGAGEFAATGAVEEFLGRPPTDPLQYISHRRRRAAVR
jgi:NAD(P)H dehydrogenase (quinone)